MKYPILISIVILIAAFGLSAMAQDNKRDAPPQRPSPQQKNGMPGQDSRGVIRYMETRTTVDCTGCMMNRLLAGSSNFFLDMSQSLGLSDAQVAKLQRIRLDYTKDTIDLQGELAIAQLELRDMLEGETMRKNDADRKIGDAYDLEAELQMEKVTSMIEALNVLTPAQREMAKSLKSRRIIAPVLGGGQVQW